MRKAFLNWAAGKSSRSSEQRRSHRSEQLDEEEQLRRADDGVLYFETPPAPERREGPARQGEGGGLNLYGRDRPVGPPRQGDNVYQQAPVGAYRSDNPYYQAVYQQAPAVTYQGDQRVMYQQAMYQRAVGGYLGYYAGRQQFETREVAPPTDIPGRIASLEGRVAALVRGDLPYKHYSEEYQKIMAWYPEYTKNDTSTSEVARLARAQMDGITARHNQQRDDGRRASGDFKKELDKTTRRREFLDKWERVINNLETRFAQAWQTLATQLENDRAGIYTRLTEKSDSLVGKLNQLRASELGKIDAWQRRNPASYELTWHQREWVMRVVSEHINNIYAFRTTFAAPYGGTPSDTLSKQYSESLHKEETAFRAALLRLINDIAFERGERPDFTRYRGLFG